MKSLKNYLIPCQILTDVSESINDEFAVLEKDGQPVLLLDGQRDELEFDPLQLDDALSLTEHDIEVLWGLDYRFFGHRPQDEAIPNIMVVSDQHGVQGIIRQRDFEDIHILLNTSGKSDGDQFGGSIGGLGISPTPVAIIWVCPMHPNERPYYAHKASKRVPPCPIDQQPRVLRDMVNQIQSQPPTKLSRIRRLLKRF